MAAGGVLAVASLSLMVVSFMYAIESHEHQQARYHDPHDALAVGKLNVDVMDFMVPIRAAELSRKMLISAVEHPEWLEQVSSRSVGETIAYDSRMGISEAEYEEYLEVSKQLSVQKAGDTELTITRPEPELYVLDGGVVNGQHAVVAGRHVIANLSGIEIDLANNIVRAPFGTLTGYSEKHISSESPLGAWDGAVWFTQGSGRTDAIASLTVGKLRRSRRSFIYLDVSRLSGGSNMWIDLLVMYDLPDDRAAQQ
ncbi:hypothetical protein [Novipirellula maiorica]|uniref:hypothetical protein n=1 Tax=Novipirellula maiorica TaxID=1265734 RepID=UPI0005944DCC|nr:hypothetical protein [Rhodopirellula maiorica]